MIKEKPAAKKSKAPKAGGKAQFNWRRVGKACLLTNDFGHHAWLGAASFRRLVSSTLPTGGREYKDLQAKGFIGDMLDLDGLAARWRGRNSHLSAGPGLHIFVLTTRCNYGCSYCQSGSSGRSAGRDMSWSVARASVDFAFKTPSGALTIEFQGGEPLLNWEVLKKTVAYARSKAGAAGKTLSIGLVSNFSLMNEARARFLLENQVSVCTSLDGPAALHNKNRPFSGGNSHAEAVRWLKYFSAKAAAPAPGQKIFKPSALLTVTKRSLAFHREIVDEYVRRGLGEIFVRPLSPIGYARQAWGSVGYTGAEFSAFYARALDYIISLNRRGVPVREKLAAILLQKIFGTRDSGYLDLRCPCGAGVGQLAYGTGGDIYTCDEGRMLASGGDELFRLGNVKKDPYSRAVVSAPARACLAASELHSQPECSRCAYAPYCGVCPVYNYSAQGSLWGSMPANDRCALLKGVFDALFLRLKQKGSREILQSWVAK
jgi:uncharacterized protein